MAAGWPTKVTYANGDVFNASDINDTNGTLNYIDPTAATDRQVLTRDNASLGDVKWADSPANTLTTTGDLYYASAANTPARLGIGSTGQILSVSGGVPAWANGGGGMTVIASGTLSGTPVDLTSIPSSYTHLYLSLSNPYLSSSVSVLLTVNNLTANYAYQTVTNAATAFTNTASSGNFAVGGSWPSSSTAYWQFNMSILNYASTTSAKEIIMATYKGNNASFENMRGFNSNAGALTSAISSIKFSPVSGATFNGGTYTLYGVK